MTVEIRRLSDTDIPAMRALNACFAEAFEDCDQYPDGKHPPIGSPDDAWLAAQLAQPHIIALVAQDRAGQIVGGLVAYVLAKLEQARSEIYIYDLAVAAPVRRQGVATRLIAWLQDHARSIGAWVIYVQADHADPPAIALYTRLGAREDVLHFDIAP